jgi:ferredoxin
VVFALGFLRPRFWCRYLCPSGAVFSLGNLLLRLTERKVESTCIDCNRCVEVCPFDAIDEDFNTRISDCTLCQTCGGACPTGSIKFVDRWNREDLKGENIRFRRDVPVSRRGFLSGALSGAILALSIRRGLGANLVEADPGDLPIRPPGSLPEREFLSLCIRCGECFQACPNNVLQPVSFEQGLEGLWTPRVEADWSGCEPSCNNCGQVCPTGAIRALPLEEKRVARMGLAVVDRQTCLPWAGAEECQLCADECNAAGYKAIEFERIGVRVGDGGMPLEGTGFRAPVVLADRCVGCGLCQSVCHRINRTQKALLSRSAVILQGGPGREDRLLSGSYRELRSRERRQEEEARRRREKELLRELKARGLEDF